MTLISADFENMKVSTRTFTATTNLIMDIEKISKFLPVYSIDDDVRFKNPKNYCDIIPDGEIASINYLGEIRGINLKPRKKTKRWFRNSFTVVISTGEKMLNFKVCRNGTFQITGALSFEHAVKCIKCIWDRIRGTSYYTIDSDENKLVALIIPAMRNLDFTLGIKINREMFDKYILETRPEYHCLLETSFGYTGLNVKKKITKPITDLKILKINVPVMPNTHSKDMSEAENHVVYCKKHALETDNDWKGEIVSYQKYLDILEPQVREAKVNHTRYNTFLVFHSGKIIQSGLSAEFMKDDFYEFCDIINAAYKDGRLEERLDE